MRGGGDSNLQISRSGGHGYSIGYGGLSGVAAGKADRPTTRRSIRAEIDDEGCGCATGTAGGVTLNAESAGSDVSEDYAVAPNRAAVMVPVVAEVTLEELMVNVA